MKTNRCQRFPPRSPQQERKIERKLMGSPGSGSSSLLFLLSADKYPSPHCPASLLELLPFKQLSSQCVITGWNCCILQCRGHQEHARPRLRSLLHWILIVTKQNNSREGEKDPSREKSGYVRDIWKVKSWVSSLNQARCFRWAPLS